MNELNLYDKVKLKTGEIARIVDILRNETSTGYVVDVEEGDDYRTETVFIDEIKSVFIETEMPLKGVMKVGEKNARHAE